MGVVHPGLGHGPEEVVGVEEADGMSGADGGVAQGLGQEGLADAGGTHQQDVLVPGQELQGEDGVQQPSVHGDGRGPVEVLQSAGLLESGAALMRSSTRRWARRLTSSERMISRKEA